MATIRAVIALLFLVSCTSTKTNYDLSEVCENVSPDRCEIRK